MSRGVAVTGMGIISAAGRSKEENLTALLNSGKGLSSAEILKTRHTNLPVGEIKLSDEQLASMLSIPESHTYTRAALLGIFAIKEALAQSGLEIDAETALISGTSVGGIDYTERYFNEFENNLASHKWIQAQHPGFTTEKIAEYFGISGLVSNISTACSSGANAIMTGARLIRTGKVKKVIVGGSDCLSKFTLNGFNSLMILSDENCRAFDANRKGLNLGEAAAYLVLEADEELNGKPVLGRVCGYGNANDAFHQTASSQEGEGAFLAMKKALETAGISPGNIDYINAHGTATLNNDLSEGRAIKRIFGEVVPAFSSTKAFTGHCLAAAGAVEAVFSLLALEQGKVFPNLNFENSIPELNMQPETRLSDKDLNYVLSNSFGFGGNCTSLIFSKDGL